MNATTPSLTELLKPKPLSPQQGQPQTASPSKSSANQNKEL